jgi:predicted Fe-S protein YdhL (DUF1289 family)
MKALSLTALLLLLISSLSCTSDNYKIGECLQKPDESSVWEIMSFNEGSAVLKQLTKVSNIQSKEVNLPSGYIKTKCRR